MVHRTDIEKALDELISNEEGMKFQSLAVVLSKQRWPELIARERKQDLGLDAYASASLSPDGRGKGLACSLTAALSKIKADATETKKHFDDIEVFIFTTPRKVTSQKVKSWADEVRKVFNYELIVMPREEIITSLMLPSNAPICRTQLGIPVAVEEDAVELIERVRDAISEVIATWLAKPRQVERPQIALQAIKLEQEGRETREILDLGSIQALLKEGRRVVLEAPAGRGKTTTLVQLAKQNRAVGGLAFLIDLPAWAKSELDILEFIARMQPFRSRRIDAGNLAKLYQIEHFSFLLNGWNEISEIHSEAAVVALRQLERSFPAAGIIVATRTHHIRPPLPGSFRAKLLPLTMAQRTEYLIQSLGNRADELRLKLDTNPVLDDLTRTPLILSEVTTIFQTGGVIPTTKMGVLGAVMRLLEQSDEHRSHLQSAPLTGHAPYYLGEIAIQMTARGETIILDGGARATANSVSVRLRGAGQIATVPEPASVLNTLCAHHVLERLDYPSDAFRFEHQQFQEFYAAMLLKRVLWDLIDRDDQDRNRAFAKQYVNEPAWEEPLCMIAEEIGVRSVEVTDEPDVVRAGKLLVEVALSVDPIFAAELSRLCGKLVWKEIRTSVGERLRSWYGIADKNHRQCALAGILASGSDDFIDIILPLLTSNDQQVRLSTYRAGTEFHPSSLGTEWQNVVKRWKEEARIDFVLELTHNRWIPEIVEDFALADPSPRVRAEAVQALSWVGSDRDIVRLLEAFDEGSFEGTVQKLAVENIPPLARPRALAAYKKLLLKAADATSRLRLLLCAAELGDTCVPEKMKDELTQLQSGKMSNLNEFVIKPALDIVRKTDPQWVSHWVAGRILDGSLWRESWINLVTSIPEDLKEKLLERIGAEDLQHTHTSKIIAVLAATADPSFAETVFSKLVAIRRSISDSHDQANQAKWAIARQLEDLLRALPPNLAVAGLSHRFAKEFDAVEFTSMIEVFNTVGRDDSDLRNQLEDDLRQKLRTYLKNGVPFILSQDDFFGSMKANLASVLAGIGQRDDMNDLVQLIRGDIERVRRGRAARARGERTPMADGAPTSYANWHVRAVAALDSGSAELVLLDLLREPEYESEAASALVRLATTRNIEEPFGYKSKDYRVVWEARAGRRPSGFDEERRQRYAIAIKQRISTLLDESATSTQPAMYYYRLKELAKLLAALDSHDSAELVLHVMALPGKWDGWRRVEALEILLFSGVKLPTEATLNVLNPTIEHVRAQGLYNDNQNVWLLKRCLCLLPFVDVPSIGIDRIRQVISETRFPPHELREIVAALGGSRCDEALVFLRQLAGADGSGLKEMGEEWIEAIAALGDPESKRILLSFVDPEAEGFPVVVSFDRNDGEFLASRIVELAQAETGIKQRILRLCDMQLSPPKRLLLSKVVARLGTLDAILARLNLIDDSATTSVPYDLWEAIETVFLERRPYGKTGNIYTLVPRSSNEIRAKLFEMALKDDRRKQSAFALLGQIEVWRLEHGRPNAEPRHPAFDSGELWPPIKAAG